MTITALRRSFVVMALVVLAAAAPVSVAFARSRTIRLTELTTYSSINAGVSSTVTYKLVSLRGKNAGTAMRECQYAQGTTPTCTATYKLKGGTIMSHASGEGNAVLDETITSATVSFAGTHGTVKLGQRHKTVRHVIVTTFSVTIRLS